MPNMGEIGLKAANERAILPWREGRAFRRQKEWQIGQESPNLTYFWREIASQSAEKYHGGSVGRRSAAF